MFCPERAQLNPSDAPDGLTLPHRKCHSAQRFVHRQEPIFSGHHQNGAPQRVRTLPSRCLHTRAYEDPSKAIFPSGTSSPTES